LYVYFLEINNEQRLHLLVYSAITVWIYIHAENKQNYKLKQF